MVDCCMALDEDIRRAYLEGKLASAIVDSGASLTCVQPLEEQRMVSTCGAYDLKGEPFTKTGARSNKIFRMAMGHLASGRNEVSLNVDLNPAARKGHTIPGGLQNNLYSVNALTQADFFLLMTQFQIKGEDLVQDVTKLITTV